MGSKELVHSPGGVLLHVVENIGVSSEGHREVGVADHLADDVHGPRPVSPVSSKPLNPYSLDYRQEVRLLKNSFVPFSDLHSGAKNPVFVVF